MAPVPRKARRPLTYENRGELCSNASAKVFARVLRREVLPPVGPRTAGWQFGAVGAGGAEVPSHEIRSFSLEVTLR